MLFQRLRQFDGSGSAVTQSTAFHSITEEPKWFIR